QRFSRFSSKERCNLFVRRTTFNAAMKKTESSRIDTLTIAVGTRQVGWRCQVEAVRCLGAEGERAVFGRSPKN
ncbi:MAG: hypothetical protein SVX43_23120, partial [Cyanobacteriota bacterium]|nr:hypothetical protein [Cyanobacteriota bacterium]